MKKINTIIFILVMFFMYPASICGQEESSRDKFSLLTMAYNKRPLLLYKGQLQINTNYKFAARTRSFDSDGKPVSLTDNGSASMIHAYMIEMKYGITDFLELGMDTYYLRNGIRSETSSTLSSSNIITSNRLYEFKGLGDLTVGTAIRLPLEYNFFDAAIRAAVTFPTAAHEPDVPSHSITDYSSPENFTVNYVFNNKNGVGVMLFNLAASGKITFSKISFEARGCYRFPATEGESIRWSWTRSGSSFTYLSDNYTYLPDRTLTLNASAHYQAAGWLDLFIGAYSFKTSSGWTEYYGSKYANPEMSLLTLEPGFELQVAPSLTIYQYAGFQLAGRNTDAPFYMLTTLSFNIFPFWK